MLCPRARTGFSGGFLQRRLPMPYQRARNKAKKAEYGFFTAFRMTKQEKSNEN
jgi:hypothetical protein